jgi:hypothetical protein
MQEEKDQGLKRKSEVSSVQPEAKAGKWTKVDQKRYNIVNAFFFDP